MSPPETQDSDACQHGGGKSRTLISRDIIESYVHCKYKGYLKLDGRSGTRSDFEVLMTELRGEILQRANAGLTGRHREEEILKGLVIPPSILGMKSPLILDAVIQSDELSLKYDGLKRVDELSRPADSHYIPILVYEGEKVRSEHRRVLEVYALALGRVQGVEPKFGLIIHGRDCRTLRVHFKGGLVWATRTLEELTRL